VKTEPPGRAGLETARAEAAATLARLRRDVEAMLAG
jgi:hypothetical protein